MPHAIVIAMPLLAPADLTRWALERLASVIPAPWAMPDSSGICLALAAIDVSDEALKRLAIRLGSDEKLIFGVGHAGSGSQALRQSLQEARIAAKISAELTQTPITRYAELGVLRLLYPLQASGALDAFCQEQLAPLLSADAHGGDALLTTLDTWFAVNGNMTEAARRLSLHRNTLIYRINRIQDCLGVSLEDSDLRLSLQLALKIRHLRKNR